jgi:uncharacterized membrane protein YvbJ
MKCPKCETLAADDDLACTRCGLPFKSSAESERSARVSQVVLVSGMCIGGMLAKGVEFKAVLPFIVATFVVVLLFGTNIFRQSRSAAPRQ